MSELRDDAVVEQQRVEQTGDADVDAVVRSLSSLDDSPVSEHVAIFDRAHEALRRVLVGQDSRVDSWAAGGD
jgi:hypothetical protein